MNTNFDQSNPILNPEPSGPGGKSRIGRRFVRILGRVALGILLLGIATASLVFAVHRMQLRRLAKLAYYPISRYVTETSPYFVLANASVIDGTGSEERKGESIVVHDGKIAWVGASVEMPAQPGAKIIDLHGATVIPGFVMLHEHLFTTSPSPSFQLAQQSATFPLLYLAAGVTTARTAGSVDPASDLRTKRRIDNAEQPGPELFLTAPYLEGSPMYRQMRALTGPDDPTKVVDNDLAQGFTSFKAYAHITPGELLAAITEAHARSSKVTGHLCTITFTEAATMGIDNLEHGLLTDTEFFSGKKPNVCPPFLSYLEEYRDSLDVHSPAVIGMMDTLIAHHIALTSTLAVFESELGGEVPAWYLEHEKNALTWQSWLIARLTKRAMKKYHWEPLFDKELQFEAEFVRRGGTLLAGADPTGDRSVLAGFADLREIELLNKAGLSAIQAIKIATLNGATFLRVANRTGSIEAGKQADLVVIKGDPAQQVSEIRNVQTVYRQGKGYDSEKMMSDVVGVIGLWN
jgi:imidazolonepropionase-like amidohydrolase